MAGECQASRTRARRLAACMLALALLLAAPHRLDAQSPAVGYVSVGAGATNLNGGMDRIVGQSRFGIGFDAGLGWVALGAFTTSYHVLPRSSRRVDLFPIVGYAIFASTEFTAHGVTVGGGSTFWPWAHVGVRLDAFRFLPVATHEHVDDRSASEYWGARVGIAFRFG